MIALFSKQLPDTQPQPASEVNVVTKETGETRHYSVFGLVSKKISFRVHVYSN